MPHKFLPLRLSVRLCTAKVAITSCLDLINRRKSSATEKRASSRRTLIWRGKTRQGRRRVLGKVWIWNTMSIELRVRWHLFPLTPVAFLAYLMLFNLQMMKHWIDSIHIILCLVVEPQFPSFRFTSFPTFPPIWIRDKDLDGIVRILCPSLAIGLKRTEELCEFHNFFFAYF